jgi:hypothetical protein
MAQQDLWAFSPMIDLIYDSEICESSSFSTTSVIPHNPSVSLGHDEPPVKLKYIANKQGTKAFNMTVGVMKGTPSLAGGFTVTNMDSTTTEAAEDVVCQKLETCYFLATLNLIQASPRWVVKPEATDESWDSDTMGYSALNANIYRWPPNNFLMADRFHDMGLDARYGMSVEVATPIQRVCFYRLMV